MEEKVNQYKEWLRKLEDDAEAIQILLNNNSPTGVICFLSQQVVEKGLKAI